MYRHSYNLSGLALLLAGAALCSVAPGECQRSARGNRSPFATGNRASTASGFGGASTSSGTAGANCPANTTGSTGTSISQTTVTTNQAAASRAVNSQMQSQFSTQAAGRISAEANADNQILVEWFGNTSSVRSVTLALFDSNGQMLSSRVVTQMPVRAVFSGTAGATHYGAQVVYSNGTKSTRYAPVN